MEPNTTRYQIGVDINSNKCHKEKKPAKEKEKIQIGTMRCLRPDNEVTDIDAASTTSQGSKISEIMKCMFFRKKETEVVEMKPEKLSAANKQSLTRDRSERSRRVVKMESMRAAPLEREEKPPDRPMTPPAAKRFLPSENPTAAFLAYVNPQNKQIRRAYSEAIKSTSAPTTDKQLHAREAFVQKHESMRHTNYRANAAIQSNVKTPTNENEDEVQNPKSIASHNKHVKKNIDSVTVVPGTTMNADEELRYHTAEDIHDLHDEIRRMKMHQREKGPPRRRREGSISVSGSGSEDSEDDEIERPKNPVPAPETDVKNYKGVKNKNMEEVIDGLYLQTQRNLDGIYQNGLSNLEGYRPESSIDEPDMTKFEKDLFSSEQPKDSGVETESGDNDIVETNTSFVKEYNSPNAKLHKTNLVQAIESKESAKHNEAADHNVNNDSQQHHIDSLLNEVSVWAKDRENWLLGRTELDNKYSESKDKIKLSHKIDFHNERRTETDLNHDPDEIDRVRASNEQRCNNWVDGKSNTPRCSQRTIDLITSPKLFTPRNSEKKSAESNIVDSNNEGSPAKIFSPRNGLTIPSHIKDIDKNDVPKAASRAPVPVKRTHKGVAVFDYGGGDANDEVQRVNESKNALNSTSILADKHNEHNKTMINGIVIPTPTFESETEDERSTICDDFSDLDRKIPFRARSPDSWLSSCGSPTNLFRKGDDYDKDFDDTLETVSSLTGDSVKVHRVAVAKAQEPDNNVGKLNPQAHVPYRGLDREGTPMPNDSQHLPLPKSMTRNTQLQPIGTGSSFRQEYNRNQIQRLDSKSGINSLTGLPSMVNDSVLKGTRNLNDFEINMNLNSRPFSEITLSGADVVSSMTGNSRFIGNSVKHQGGFQNKAFPSERVDYRPASETIPAKRTDKVGMGHVMATDSTRERNRYAKDIVKTMELKRQEPQKAFMQQEASTAKPKHNDAAFISQLLQGGYSYDKHSSRRLSSASGNASRNEPSNVPDERDLNDNGDKSNQHSTTSVYAANVKPVTRSNVSASFNENRLVSKSQNASSKPHKSESFASPRLNGGYSYDYDGISQTKRIANSLSKGTGIHDPNDTTTSAYDSQVPTKIRTENVNKSTVNAEITGDSQGKSDASFNKTTEQVSHGSISTAEKFRKMRNKRNQEMQWLMKDAAETEV